MNPSSALPASIPPHPPFATLPQPRTSAGELRRVGVEIEFVGLDAAAAAAALVRAFGGRLDREDAHAYVAAGTLLGDLAVERDSRFLHPGRDQPLRMPRLPAWAAAWAGHALRAFIPCELVTTPLPFPRLPEVDRAVGALRLAGARGTGASAFASLGLHLNVEAVTTDGRGLAAMTKAFLLLEPFLRRSQEATLPRWRPRFPGRFPDRFREKVLDPAYWPDTDGFIEDYLADNPTRDRGLDLLPVLLWLDPRRVRARVPLEKIKPRPAFHYRLPFAHVGRESWSIAPDWNHWVEVERLAADAGRLDRLCRRLPADAMEELEDEPAAPERLRDAG